MLKIYVDSSYDWTTTSLDGTGEGEICIFIPSKNKIYRKKLTLNFPGLKQLNNRFELEAIKAALKLTGKKDFIIYSDSKIAVSWINNPNVKWVSREKNLAGQILKNYPYKKPY